MPPNPCSVRVRSWWGPAPYFWSRPSCAKSAPRLRDFGASSGISEPRCGCDEVQNPATEFGSPGAAPSKCAKARHPSQEPMEPGSVFLEPGSVFWSRNLLRQICTSAPKFGAGSGFRSPGAAPARCAKAHHPVALSGPSVTDCCCSILLFSAQCTLALGRTPLCYGVPEGGWWSREDHQGGWAGPSPKALGGSVGRPEPRTR